MTEEKNTIMIDDVEHNVNDFDDNQKYFVIQIKDIDIKLQNLKFQLDQSNVAKSAFVNALIASIKKEKEVDNETKDGNDS
jgi:hypothetical protein